MDATQVVIHFIGLVLFSTQVSNDPGLHAILPAIHAAPQTDTHVPPVPPLVDVKHLAPARALEPSPGARAVAPASLSANIEPHVALLIFHQDIVANDSQWPTSTILSKFPHAKALASYRFVALTGEHITFIVDAPGNPRAKLPTNLPRFSCGTLRLTSGYQWPYAQAAAVVDIPEGRLWACEPRKIASGRIDTRLVLNTTGMLTVVAVKSGVLKTLVLKTTGKPTIYLANVPPPRIKGTNTAISGPPHFQAYWQMIGRGQINTCSGPPIVAKGAPPLLPCEPAFAAPVTSAGPGSMKEYLDVGVIFSANAECSNTQWP